MKNYYTTLYFCVKKYYPFLGQCLKMSCILKASPYFYHQVTTLSPMKTRVQKFYDQTQWLSVKQLKPISPINTFQWPQKTKVTQRTFFNNNVFTFWSSLAIINIFKFTNFYHAKYFRSCCNSSSSFTIVQTVLFPYLWFYLLSQTNDLCRDEVNNTNTMISNIRKQTPDNSTSLIAI